MAENDLTLQTAKELLKKKIEDFIHDTATLDVMTLTGTINLVEGQDSTSIGDKVVDWDAVFKKVTDGMQTDGENTLSVVAYTHAEWDQDSVNYVAKNADVKLVEAHGKTVAAAHESRINALKSVAEAVDKLFT